MNIVLHLANHMKAVNITSCIQYMLDYAVYTTRYCIYVGQMLLQNFLYAALK